MIIRTRTNGRPFHRRTQLDPITSTLRTTLHTLTKQWDLEDDASNYALLVSVQGGTCDDRLLIDKDAEWHLLCEERGFGDKEIEMELIRREDVLQSTGGRRGTVSSVQSAKAKAFDKSVESDVQRSPLYKAFPFQSSEPSPLTSMPPQQPPPSAAPKYAFHSVEPQAIKPRTYAHARSKQNDESPASTSVQEAGPSTAEQKPQQPMTMDEIMARSKRQGESLNQLFGTLQARSAGRPREKSMAESEREIESEGGLEGEQAEAVDVSPEPPLTSSTAAADAAATDENATGPLSPRRPQRSVAEIEDLNTYLSNAWQERLTQMGHGPNSGSAYARLRREEARAQGAPVNEETENALPTRPYSMAERR